MQSLSRIGFVAIGRNEGDRLIQCLQSVDGNAKRIVYVDSGSTDGSCEAAERLGAQVINLDLSSAFTAARARNAGWRPLASEPEPVQYVQFVDGDCTMASGWLETARDFLDQHTDCAAVCGRLREVHPTRNALHQIADIEWDTPAGWTTSTGGIVMMRTEALLKADGFRDSLIAGEEPELCVRLRQAGWKIYRHEADMALHDVNMTSWRQWWKRCVRAGYAFAEGAALHGSPPERHWVKETRSVLLWGALFPLIALSLGWVTWGISILGLIMAYQLQVIRIARSLQRTTTRSPRECFLYAVHCVAAKFPQAVGVLKYRWNRLTGGSQSIIEYRPTPPASS